ncbi:MAG: sigma-70 family RNA polymerase sigma factor [Gammaproteobacteria bacterium]|nr:sigma-70 family RNA polymerase sigma factor [Gammaproteobacteria bacterium]MBK9665805.1 sigma-70 family RNA polymerase sigma factor [Gammaproteobacteria bacterium]
MESSDEELVARAAGHDGRHAFAMLVARHQSDVRNSLRRFTRGNIALADDLAQETFIRAYRSIASFRRDSSFRSWIYRIAYRCFLDELRRNEPAAEEIGDQHPSAGEDHEAREFMDHFDAAMRQLSQAQRDAVHFSLQRGFSHPEIADIMAMPVGTVKTHVLRGRQKLQEILSDWQGGFSNE